MTIDKQDRLFVPLNTEHYRNFENGSKDIELRGVSGRFNVDTVYEGRSVELRRGYNGESLWGTIGMVHGFGSIRAVPRRIDHTRILPGSAVDEFIDSARGLLDGYEEYIAFEVTAL